MSFRFPPPSFVLGLLTAVPNLSPLVAVAAEPPLTHAAAVLALKAEDAARRLPIEVTGVVTAAEPDWSGQFFLQDATGGVFVENLRPAHPSPGDVVTVRGVSHPGAFAPIISSPEWTKLGTAALPAPKVVDIVALESGTEDGLRVEIAGIVRSVQSESSRTTLELAIGGFRLQVCAPPSAVGRPEALLAARVRVRGTAATHYNAALRHLTSVAVYVPHWDDVMVLEPEAADPFQTAPIPLRRVAEYRPGSRSSGRIHVRGTVTHQRAGEVVYLVDETGGLPVMTQQKELFAPGAVVAAAGFLEFRDHLPVLRDAILRRNEAAPATPVVPRRVTLDELKKGLHHASLVTLTGRLLDRTSRTVARVPGGGTAVSTTLWLQAPGLSFTVEHESAGESAALAAIPLGSTLELDGVCTSTVDVAGRLQSLKLLLPSTDGVRVLARPSWFTPRRLLIGFAAVSAVLLLAVGWILTISRKNRALRASIREREAAQRALQGAHDTLEQKVIERSAQLQTEMTARKTAEVQFKAVLAERTRLARDLHDTLEQTLTGIALQLDTAARLFERDAEQSRHHLELARGWLQQSQIGLRGSIWDLRSRELEQFDLARALQQSAEQLVSACGVDVHFTTRGERRPLPEVVEENVLRIGQEAFTNVAKHAKARRLDATLEFAPGSLRLRVEDNGEGFDSPAVPTVGERHFGLIGMTERAKRLGGRVRVESERGRGTVVAVDIPLDPLEDSGLPKATNDSQ